MTISLKRQRVRAGILLAVMIALGAVAQVQPMKDKMNVTVSGRFCHRHVSGQSERINTVIWQDGDLCLTVNRSGNITAAGKLSFTDNGWNRQTRRWIDSKERVDDGLDHQFMLAIHGGVVRLVVDGYVMEKVVRLVPGQSGRQVRRQAQAAVGQLDMRELKVLNGSLPQKELKKLFGDTSFRSVWGSYVPETYAVPPVSRGRLYVVQAITTRKRLPFAPPEDGDSDGLVDIMLTPGEFEPASVVLEAETDLTGVTVKVEGVPSSWIDIRTVKCHYQAGGAWKTIRINRSQRLLTPELLLHDDSLVQVDYRNQRNYVCINGRYADMSQMEPVDQPGMGNHEFPVRDAKTLQPFSLKAGQFKQLWLTAQVGKNCASGVYDGRLRLFCKDRELCSVPLRMTVLPFRLDALKHVDGRRPFYSSIYYKGILAKSGSVFGWEKTEQQYRADLKNMLEHGVDRPMIHQLERTWDWTGFHRALAIRKDIGIQNEPLFLLGRERNLGFENAQEPEVIQNACKVLKRLKHEAGKHGIQGLYVYGIDESTGDLLKSQLPIWKAFHKTPGVKLYQAGFLHGRPNAHDLVGDTLDVFIAAGETRKEYAGLWHRHGKAIWSYLNPQGGVEDPELYRRNFGLDLWRKGYDGACTYVYHHGYGHSWNDFDHPQWRDHNLTYPTVDGVIDTIAWEGYREAMDDIRYGVTLMRMIREAESRGDTTAKRRAKQARAFLETCELGIRNLDTVRREIIFHILTLGGY